MAELEEILQGYGAMPNYWEEREIRPLLDTLRDPSPDWHPIIQREFPNIDVKEVFREFRRAVARRLEATPIAWDSGKMSADERITFLELAAPELLPPWDEPPSSRGVGRANTLEMLQLIAGSIPDDWATLVGLLAELAESALPERWEHNGEVGYVMSDTLESPGADLCERMISFCQAELARVGARLGSELTHNKWLTWCTLIWLPGTSLGAQLALLVKALDCLADQGPADVRSAITLSVALTRWELSERVFDRELASALQDQGWHNNYADADEALNMADYLMRKGDFTSSGAALITAEHVIRDHFDEANSASLFVYARHGGGDLEDRSRACEAAVAVAPNPVAQMEIGLLFLEYMRAEKPPYYAPGLYWEELDMSFVDVTAETENGLETFNYTDLTMDGGMFDVGAFRFPGEQTPEHRQRVLSLAIRALGCALGSPISTFGKLICLDGLRCAFLGLPDLQGLEAACLRGLTILKEDQYSWPEFFEFFQDGMGYVITEVRRKPSLEEYENRLRQEFGGDWDGLCPTAQRLLRNAEYQLETAPPGGDYDVVASLYARALEAQLRAGLGRKIEDLLRDRNTPVNTSRWGLPDFSRYLRDPNNKGILLRLLASPEAGRAWFDFFTSEGKLLQHLDEIIKVRHPVSHGDLRAEPITYDKARKIRLILIDAEHDGGQALMVNLARYGQYPRTSKP